MNHSCKKCLLLEAGEKVTYEQITKHIQTIDSSDKADEKTIKLRLEKCRKCDFLISGMCRKCGCYVEIRAVLKEQHCPDFDNRKW